MLEVGGAADHGAVDAPPRALHLRLQLRLVAAREPLHPHLAARASHAACPARTAAAATSCKRGTAGVPRTEWPQTVCPRFYELASDNGYLCLSSSPLYPALEALEAGAMRADSDTKLGPTTSKTRKN